MKGSASAPSSATMNGTRCAIRPAMNAHVTREPSSLATRTGHLRCGQRCGELRPSVEGVGSLAGFDLCELAGNRDALALGKASHGCALSFQAET
jgi:hypothetical protein